MRPKKPGPNYFWNGREWVWIQQRQPPARPPARPPIRPGGGKRPPQLTPEQWARQQAQKFIDAQVAGINSQRQTYLDEVKAQSELEAQRGLALAQALQGMDFGGKIQQIYGQGAADVAGLAGGFSEAMRGTADAQAAEMVNMLGGAGQEGAVRNEGVGMGDVVYGTQGFIPGRSMSESGAAFGAQAALEPSFAARIGQLEAGRVHSEGMKGLDQFTQALIEAKSGKPGLVQEMLDRRKGDLQDQREWSMKVMEQERDWYLQQAALADRLGDSKRANYYLKLAQQREQRMIMQSKGYAPDGTLLPGFKLDKQGNVVKVNAARGPGYGKSGAAKGPDWGDIQKDIAADVPDLTVEIDDPEDYHRPPRKIEVKMRYQDAFDRLMATYGGLVKDKARLKALIKKVLAANGIKPKAPRGASPNPATAPGTFSGDR